MDKTCKFHELWLNTELIFCDYPKAYGKILLAFRRGNQFHANSRSAYKVTRGRPIHRFCRLIGTIIDLQNYQLSAKIHADSFVLLLLLERLRRVCYHYTVWERPLEARNHWQHVLFVLTRDTALHRAGNFKRAFKCSQQKILPRNRAPFT